MNQSTLYVIEINWFFLTGNFEVTYWKSTQGQPEEARKTADPRRPRGWFQWSQIGDVYLNLNLLHIGHIHGFHLYDLSANLTLNFYVTLVTFVLDIFMLFIYMACQPIWLSILLITLVTIVPNLFMFLICMACHPIWVWHCLFTLLTLSQHSSCSLI